jgi:hypothetical protein
LALPLHEEELGLGDRLAEAAALVEREGMRTLLLTTWAASGGGSGAGDQGGGMRVGDVEAIEQRQRVGEQAGDHFDTGRSLVLALDACDGGAKLSFGLGAVGDPRLEGGQVRLTPRRPELLDGRLVQFRLQVGEAGVMAFGGGQREPAP